MLLVRVLLFSILPGIQSYLQYYIHIQTELQQSWASPTAAPVVNKRRITRGPRFGTPPQLLSFKEAVVVTRTSRVRRYPTSVEERQNVFQMTFSRQVVRPLISLTLSISLATSGTKKKREGIYLYLSSTSVFLSPCRKTSCSHYPRALLSISPIHHFFSPSCACHDPRFLHVTWKHTRQNEARKEPNAAAACYSSWFSAINWREAILKSSRGPT